MAILLVAIGYFLLVTINGYYWILMIILLVVISGYYINHYW